MCYQLKTALGATEAVIDDNCGITKFHAIADTLSSELQITFHHKSGNSESADWHFRYKRFLMRMRYHAFSGISILPQSARASEKANRLVMELAYLLERRAY